MEKNQNLPNQIEIIDNKLINKFNDKPLYSYNEENALEIDRKWIIILRKIKIIVGIKFKLFGKTYIQMSKN